MRQRDLLVLVGGMGLSSIGTHITFIALPFHLRDHGPLVVSAVMMASLVPVALGAPVAGWLVDRYANRRIMLHAQVAAAAAVFGMLFVLDDVPLVLVLLLVLGSASAVTAPAMSALLPKITGEQGATRGYSALATARSFGALAGLGLGGALASGPGIRIALVIDTVSFLVLAAGLTTVRADRDPMAEVAGGQQRESAVDGLRRLRSDRVLQTAIGGLTCAVLLAVLANVAEVFFVTEVLDAGGLTFGLVAAAWGLGMVAGAKLAGGLDTDRKLTIGLFAGGIGMGTALLLPAAVPTVAVMLGAWLVGGACNAAQNVAIQGLVRSRLPDQLRGRAFAGMNSVVVSANVLGTFAGGTATAAIGPRAVFVAAGVGTVLSAGAALAVVLPHLREPTVWHAASVTPPQPRGLVVRDTETASNSVVRLPAAAVPLRQST